MRLHNSLYFFLVTWEITRTVWCGPGYVNPWTQDFSYEKDAPCTFRATDYKSQNFETPEQAIEFMQTQPVNPLNDIFDTVVSNVEMYEIIDDKYEDVSKVIDYLSGVSDILPLNTDAIIQVASDVDIKN